VGVRSPLLSPAQPPSAPALWLSHARALPALPTLCSPPTSADPAGQARAQDRPAPRIFFKALRVLETSMRSLFGDNFRDHLRPPDCHPLPVPLRGVLDRCLLPSLIAYWAKAGGGRSRGGGRVLSVPRGDWESGAGAQLGQGTTWSLHYCGSWGGSRWGSSPFSVSVPSLEHASRQRWARK